MYASATRALAWWRGIILHPLAFSNLDAVKVRFNFCKSYRFPANSLLLGTWHQSPPGSSSFVVCLFRPFSFVFVHSFRTQILYGHTHTVVIWTLARFSMPSLRSSLLSLWARYSHFGSGQHSDGSTVVFVISGLFLRDLRKKG